MYNVLSRAKISQNHSDLGRHRTCWTVSQFAAIAQGVMTNASGQYDTEYLDYLRALIKSMSEYGLVCYIVRGFSRAQAHRSNHR